MKKTYQVGNIKREVHTGNALYDYAIDTNEFANLWYQMHKDLGYPLQIDSRYKRAIVYNKQGLEQKIQKMLEEVIGKNGQVLADIIANDINNKLDSLTQTANGKTVTSKSGSSHILATALTKGLVNGFIKILDDITTPDDNYRR